jgi:hypothetical protein
MAAVLAQLTLEGLDGSVQVEPFSIPDAALGEYSTFLSTNNNFAVAKTDSYVTDIVCSTAPAVALSLRLFVNGRDTGIRMLTGGLITTVNNRMPSKPGIGEGASIQFVSGA